MRSFLCSKKDRVRDGKDAKRTPSRLRRGAEANAKSGPARPNVFCRSFLLKIEFVGERPAFPEFAN
ncbi:hypothetical protein CH375_05320 [Leptospira ellisii]|nr:hypothetical protein CH375_05320 [Leptospira ellisii]